MIDIQLGDKVRDRVSGFEGLVLARMDALYEASSFRVHLDHLAQDGTIRSSQWLEAGRLEKVESKKVAGFMQIMGSNRP